MVNPSVAVAGPCLTVFPPRSENQKTVCVIGAPRGGTSMIAGIVRKLGVYMGEDIDPANNEDREFLKHSGNRELFVRGKSEFELYKKSIQSLIKMRDGKHDVWGWKDPISYCYLRDVLGAVRNPVFLFVTRDPGAIAQREIIEERVTNRRRLLAYMKTSFAAYDDLVDILVERARPTLLISYERALRAPDQLGWDIAHILGIKPPPDFDSWVSSYVQPDRRDGSIEVDRATVTPTRQFASTPAVQLLLQESLRPHRDSLIDVSLADLAETSPMVAANRLYDTAVTALGGANIEDAEANAIAIANIFSRSIPHLIDGPIGVLAERIAGGGKAPEYPDIVCGAYYLLGLVQLMKTSAQAAIIYFDIGEWMMRTRIMRGLPDSILSRGNYWNCVLHWGIAAKVLNRSDLVGRLKKFILGDETSMGWGASELRNQPELETAKRRAQAEL